MHTTHLPFVEVRITLSWRSLRRIVQKEVTVSQSQPVDPFADVPIFAPAMGDDRAPTADEIEAASAHPELDGVPPAVADVFKRLALKDGTYRCTIVRSEEAGGEVRCPAYENRIPSESEIGEKFGPGRYYMEFNYPKQGWKTGRDTKRTEWFTLSDHYRDIHENYKDRLEEQRLNDARRKTELREAKMSRQPQPSGMDFKEVMTIVLTTLPAVLQAIKPAPPPPDNTKELFMVMLTQQNENARQAREDAAKQSENTMRIFSQMNENSNKNTMMFVNAIMNRNNDSGDKMIDKVLDLVGGARRVQDAISAPVAVESAEPPSLLEKIIDGVGMVVAKLPMLQMVAPTLPEQQQMVQSVMDKSPDTKEVVDQLRKNQELRGEAIVDSVAKYGPKQSRSVLQVCKVPFTEEDIQIACEAAGVPYAPPEEA